MSSRRRRDSRDSRSSSNSRTRSRPRYQSPPASGSRNWNRRDRNDIGNCSRWKDDRERERDRVRERFDDRNRPAADRERFTNRRSATRSRSRSLRRSRSRSHSRYADRRDDRRPTHGTTSQNYDSARRETADRGNQGSSRWNQRTSKDVPTERAPAGASSAQKSRKSSQKVSVASCGDWEAYLSSAGKPYFYNVIEQRSTWNKPSSWNAEADEQMNAAIANATKHLDSSRNERPGTTADRERDRDRDRDSRARDWRNDSRRRSADRNVQRTRERERDSRERQSPRAARNHRPEKDNRDRDRPTHTNATFRTARPRKHSSSRSRSHSRDRNVADSDAESVSSSLATSSLRSLSSNSMSRSRSSSTRSRSPEANRPRAAAARNTTTVTRDSNTAGKSALDTARRADSTAQSSSAPVTAESGLEAANGVSRQTSTQRFSVAARSVPESPTPASPGVGVIAATSGQNPANSRNASAAFLQPQTSTSSPNVAGQSNSLAQSNSIHNSNVNANAHSANSTSADGSGLLSERANDSNAAQLAVTSISHHIAAVMQATALPEYQPISTSQKESARFFDERLIASVVEALAPASAIDKAADTLAQRSRERDEAAYMKLCFQLKMTDTRSLPDQLHVAIIDSRIAEYKLNATNRCLRVQQQPTWTN